MTIKWGKVTHEGVELNPAAPVLAFKQAVYTLTGACKFRGVVPPWSPSCRVHKASIPPWDYAFLVGGEWWQPRVRPHASETMADKGRFPAVMPVHVGGRGEWGGFHLIQASRGVPIVRAQPKQCLAAARHVRWGVGWAGWFGVRA